MKIDNIKIRLVVDQPNGKLKAFAMVTLGAPDPILQLCGLRIYDGAHGLFVSYPNDPAHKGNDYRQLYYPLTKDFRDAIEEAIIAEYHEQVKENS